MDVALQFNRSIEHSNKTPGIAAWKRSLKQLQQNPGAERSEGGCYGPLAPWPGRQDLPSTLLTRIRLHEVSRERSTQPLPRFMRGAQLTEEINAAYDEELEQEDREFLARQSYGEIKPPTPDSLAVCRLRYLRVPGSQGHPAPTGCFRGLETIP